MGAYLGSRTHEEIAVSVVAELIAVRRLGHDLQASWERRGQKAGAEGVRDLPQADRGAMSRAAVRPAGYLRRLSAAERASEGLLPLCWSAPL